MTVKTHSWRERLKYANWQLLWLLPIALILILATAWWSRADRTPDTAECSRLYRLAETASDTVTVDQTVPNVTNPKFRDESVKCGVLRQLGKLH